MFDDFGDHGGIFADGRTHEAEIALWRSSMIGRIIKYVKLFNPMDMVFALEGTEVWRNDVVKEYYEENCDVYYDKEAYYLRYDNFLYKVTKKNGELFAEKLNFNKQTDYLSKTHKKLSEMPDRVKDIFWNSFLPNGTTPLLPVYKGKRQKQAWDFVTDKKYWREYKEGFAEEVSKLFRSKAIRMNEAEGDDVIYVTCNYYKDKYDSIILITGDSDMNQLLTIPNLKIYNHRQDDLVICSNPSDYLEIKILQGDSSDNINGMARPNKTTQLGESGAEKLFEANDNIYSLATKEGWDNQYRRNQTLIDLSYIPTKIQRTICEMLDDSKPVLCEIEELYQADFNKKRIDELLQLKNLGYYTMLDKDYANDNPDVFNPDAFKKKEEELNLDMNVTKREFGSMNGIFSDPLAGEDIF